MADNVNKIKLLKIVGFLSTNSSQNMPATTNQIIDYLVSIGISCDRRTLYRDMDLLLDCDLGIVKTEVSRENAYYIENDALTLAELKILIDAVQAANFITPDKTSDLMEKLMAMAGTRKKEILRKNTIFYNNHKHSNEDIFDNIEKIEIAIQKKRQVSFYYFDLNEKHERVYRHNGKKYNEQPLSMILDDGNYYILCYTEDVNCDTDIKTFRLDRMSDVAVSDEMISDEAVSAVRSIKGYPKQVFKMYGGETCRVRLQFDEGLIGVIFNKFGENTRIRQDKDKYSASVNVQISPTFWGWLAQFAGQMKIVSPDDVIEEYVEWLQTALRSQNEGH